jgi:hypothetical protein
MVSEAVRNVAEKMPEHQTSRGAEFRNISVEQRYGMSRALVIARSQVNASNADWDSTRYREHMRRKRELYLYRAGALGVDMNEATTIWWSIVYEGIDTHPARKHKLGLI